MSTPRRSGSLPPLEPLSSKTLATPLSWQKKKIKKKKERKDKRTLLLLLVEQGFRNDCWPERCFRGSNFQLLYSSVRRNQIGEGESTGWATRWSASNLDETKRGTTFGKTYKIRARVRAGSNHRERAMTVYTGKPASYEIYINLTVHRVFENYKSRKGKHWQQGANLNGHFDMHVWLMTCSALRSVQKCFLFTHRFRNS